MNTNVNDTKNDALEDLEVPEFDFERALPNPFVEQYREGVTRTVIKNDGTKDHFVRLEPDIAEHYPSAAVVNDILRRALNG
jgi:hypothetical protein